MIPFWCACWTAWQTGMNSSSRSRGVSRCSSQYLVIGMPLTSSMTKYGRPGLGRARVEHLGDVRVIHQGERLALGLEASQHLPRVHTRLDELERDHAPNRFRLLGHVDRAHAALADLLKQLVRADVRAKLWTRSRGERFGPLAVRRHRGRRGRFGFGSLQEIAGAGRGCEQRLHLRAPSNRPGQGLPGGRLNPTGRSVREKGRWPRGPKGPLECSGNGDMPYRARNADQLHARISEISQKGPE